MSSVDGNASGRAVARSRAPRLAPSRRRSNRARRRTVAIHDRPTALASGRESAASDASWTRSSARWASATRRRARARIQPRSPASTEAGSRRPGEERDEGSVIARRRDGADRRSSAGIRILCPGGLDGAKNDSAGRRTAGTLQSWLYSCPLVSRLPGTCHRNQLVEEEWNRKAIFSWER